MVVVCLLLNSASLILSHSVRDVSESHSCLFMELLLVCGTVACREYDDCVTLCILLCNHAQNVNTLTHNEVIIRDRRCT